MKPSEFLRVAWGSIRSNKTRSLLTMLGIIIGVAAVIVMISISSGTEAAIEEQITGLGSNLVYVQASFARGEPSGKSDSGGLVYDDAFAIANEVDGVQAVVVEQDSSETVQSEEVAIQSVAILGTTSDFPSVRDMEIDAGRYFIQDEVDRNQKVVVLGSSLAEELFGDSDPIGERVTVGTTKLTIIGVFEERGLVGNEDFDSRLYLPISVVFQKFTPSKLSRLRGDRVKLITVELENSDEMDDVILQIQLLLANLHDVSLEEPDFSVVTQQNIIETQEATTAAFRNLLSWVAGVSLIVGGIGIMNIMLVSVTERTREIGIRQSVGATPDDIRWQFLTEALLLSLIGGVIGVFVGIGGSWIFGVASEMHTILVPGSILLAFTAAAGVGAFFGYYPANQAAQLDPIEALRYE